MRFRLHELMAVDGFLVSRIEDTAKRRQKTRQVWRTAGAVKNFDPLCNRVPFRFALVQHRVDGQRVFIKERIAVQRNACQHTVVQNALHRVGIFRPVFQQLHPPGKECQCNGRARFRIRRAVRQIIIDGKRFTVRG